MTTLLQLTEACRLNVLAAIQADEDANPITTTYSGVGIVAWDDCCGQLTVNPQRSFESIVFPQEYIGQMRCDDTVTVTELLVTLVRCVPVPDENGKPPKPADLQIAHARILTDAQTVWSALVDPTWFLGDEWEINQPRQRFVGAQGGCISIEHTLLVGVPTDEWMMG